MKYLTDIKTLEDLKKAYHAWAVKLHPDLGGSVEEMQELNNEYDSLFSRVKNKHTNSKGETYEKETNEAPENFRDIIDELLGMNHVTIEVIGCFVWVSGETRHYKEQLKALGFKWHSKKTCWYLAPDWYRRYGKKAYSMNDIRAMYGVRYEEETNLKEISA